MRVVKRSILKKVYKKRDPWSHKYDFGHLLVIGGSKHYSGSPTFNALAALRAGVDLVTVVAPERAANLIASFKPDLIAYPLKGDHLMKKHVKDLFEFTEKKDAVVIGGGLGRREETLEAITDYLKGINTPCVIDADAIHAVARKKEILKGKPFVLTPHAYEFFVLSGTKVGTNVKERIRRVEELARKLGTTILLKGHIDVISNGKETMINETGCSYMTVGGLGDILAGIVGAMLARGVDCFTAACASAYINGLAGELAAKKFGESMIASDVLNEIHKVIRMVR